jgi:hypothetical protein
MGTTISLLRAIATFLLVCYRWVLALCGAISPSKSP